MAQTTQDASFGPFVSFFKISFVFIVTNDCIRYYLSTRGAAATKTGPNDAFGIVWAIRKLFFFLSCFTDAN